MAISNTLRICKCLLKSFPLGNKEILTKKKDKMWTQISTNILEGKLAIRQCALSHMQNFQGKKQPQFRLS